MKTKKLVKKIKKLEGHLLELLDKLNELTDCYSDHIVDYHTTEETKETGPIQNVEEEK
jgi:hypothetical protein